MEQDPTQVDGPKTARSVDAKPSPIAITEIDEFSIRSELGRGGFGVVYLAYDNILQREVALKVPHSHHVESEESVEMYLHEARALASLDHPSIIPVYRAAQAKIVPFYIASKRIRGCNLRQWVGSSAPQLTTLVRIFATIADALAFAHKSGIVHRDIKPSNILIDEQSHPFIADFGLALRDIDPKSGPSYVGTPAYMSPEQVRGEGHRIDGRSDIFSLGALMYELLTGHQPFKATTQRETHEATLYNEPEDPGRLNHEIPRDLAHVCMKCLSKGVHDRYASADLLAGELRSSLHGVDATQSIAFLDLSKPTSRSRQSISEPKGEAQVVPKGLQPFDTRDADYFLSLLPGPYDRNGVPEIVRFWVSKIGEKGTDSSNSVGLIYGPSGCGKTSLVRAGIMPQLGRDVEAIYLQASPHDTEKRLTQLLLSRMHRIEKVPADEVGVVEAFTMVRRQRKNKVVIFIDQFEQWLFTHSDSQREPLTQALRQCDGEYLQCVLMVRDDFWMGVTRLMQALDLPIAENINATVVDLFDVRHARKVLQMFGEAYGRLPHSNQALTPAQTRFLDAAIEYLNLEGRIICVQLSLLTEMLKHRPWDQSLSLLQDGGAGIGMQFLESTFESDQSPRRIRVHASAAIGVLRVLLPESGSSIKGALRKREELFEASGYNDRSQFSELLSILDRELHLITPSDRVESDSMRSGSSAMGSDSTASGFQLTHDFLIAPVRQWVEYRHRDTKEGKARLRLDEFAELYKARPKTKSLPTMLEYYGIRRFIDPKSFNESQRRMMSEAHKHHQRTLSIWGAMFLLLALSTYTAYHELSRRSAIRATKSEFAQLVAAKMDEATVLAEKLRDSDVAKQEADLVLADSKRATAHQVRAALVVRDTDPRAVDLLKKFLSEGPPDEVFAIARQCDPSVGELSEIASQTWQDQSASPTALIRAATLIANDPNKLSEFETEAFVDRVVPLVLADNPIWIKLWADAFRPVSAQVVQNLRVLLQGKLGGDQSLNATNWLIEYASKDSSMLATLVLESSPSELAALSEAITNLGDSGSDAIMKEWEREQKALQLRRDPLRPWGSPWWCVGNRKPLNPAPQSSPPSGEMLEKLADWDSIVDSQIVISHKIPKQELVEVDRAVSEAGYRMASLSLYSVDSKVFASASWTRDGATSRFAFDSTKAEILTQNEKNRSEGFLPDSIAGRRVDADTILYCAVWIHLPESETGSIDADLYLDLPDRNHETQGWGPITKRGFAIPRSNLHVRKGDGEDYHSSVRWKMPDDHDFQDQWNLEWEEFESIEKFDRSFLCVQASPSLQTKESQLRGVTSIWWENVPVETSMVKGLGRGNHLRRSQSLIAEGYYPVSINVSTLSDDPTPLFYSTWWRGTKDVKELYESSRRMANLASTLYRVGNPQLVIRCLANSQDAAIQGAMTSSFAKNSLSTDWLMRQINDPKGDLAIRRQCVLALSLYEASALQQRAQAELELELPQLYHSAEDPGLRSAFESLALAANIELGERPSGVPTNELTSFAGDRMVIVRPKNPMWMGSPGSEPGRDHTNERIVAINLMNDFAISTREVTVAQFQRFSRDHKYAKGYAATTDCPIIDVSWFDAARYCRWLSEKEGTPESEMCYPPIDEIKSGMELVKGFAERSGYRLPTEAEWEYACRGGVDAGRSFGFDPEVLRNYAWTTQNSDYQSQPVGNLLPNHFGLFDMLGNAMEWCNTEYETHEGFLKRPMTDPGTKAKKIEDRNLWMTRGGANLYQPLDARAAQRHYASTPHQRVYITFRIARTVTADQ